jgi:hypothetical protein
VLLLQSLAVEKNTFDCKLPLFQYIFSKFEVCTEAGQHSATLLGTKVGHTTRGNRLLC